MIYKPYPYQEHSTEHIIRNPGCGLLLEMGLGKTVATLTAIDQLIYDHLEVQKVLVIAPKRVAENVWSSEAGKWDHLNHLKLSLVLGSETQRKTALRRSADIYVINRENVAWLVSFYGGAFPFDMMVIDELSSFKSSKSIRFKALRQIRPKVKRVVGLTGTPAPNSLLDLWSEMYLLDMGERLGKTFTGYREKYFNATSRNGFIVYKYGLKDEKDKDLFGEDIYKKEIYEKISDICISMKAKDYLSLPERIIRDVQIIFPDEIKLKYDEFERDQVLAMENIDDISAVNAAALTTKLLQFANGAVYGTNGDFHEVHNEKLEELEEIIEAANGQPVLVAYTYRHDLIRIKNYLKKYNPVELKDSRSIDLWNQGKIQLMVAHPASAGHGLNLQAGGNIIVLFGQTWSLELYQQFIARLDRQGQTKSVIVHRLISMGTMDERVVKVLDEKNTSQNALIDAVRAMVRKYRVAV